jgi:hypothetical protein
MKKKKYDFVVGNPPYVKVQHLASTQKEMLERSFKTATGLYDLYTLFVELGINQLNDKGKLGYIISDKFIQRGYGEPLRKIISEETTINEIIDFGDVRVFDGVTNYPLILILTKPAETDAVSKVVKVKKENAELLKIISNTDTDADNEDVGVKFVKHRDFVSDWSFSSGKLKRIFDGIGGAVPLNDICDSIQVGIQTGNDDLLVFHPDFITHEMDSKFLKPYVKGREVKRYSGLDSQVFVFYPYIVDQGKQRLITEVELKQNPKLYNFIQAHKPDLEKRWGVKTYYDLPTARTIEWFEKKKIITPDVSAAPNFTLIDSGKYFSKGSCYGIILKQNKLYEFVLGLLNSKLLFAIFKDRSALFSGGYYRFTTDFMGPLPIKLPTNKNEEIIAEKITAKVKEVLKLKKKDTSADTKKLEDEIDGLVFDLYGITPEERKIIEKAVEG